MIMQHYTYYVLCTIMTFAICVILDSFYKCIISVPGIHVHNCVYQLHESYEKTLIPLKTSNLEFLLGLRY